MSGLSGLSDPPPAMPGADIVLCANGCSGRGGIGSFLPSTGYAFVLLLVNLDLIGFVVLTLLPVPQPHQSLFRTPTSSGGSGFRAKTGRGLHRIFLIPTVLLAFGRQRAGQQSR